MTITNTSSEGNSINTQFSNIDSVHNGYVIPDWWFRKIRTGGRKPKPDTISYFILSDLISAYNSTGQTYFQKNADYFIRRHGFTECQVIKCFERLEKLKIIKRKMAVSELHDRIRVRVLHIKLNIEKLISLAPENIKANIENIQINKTFKTIA